MRTTDRQKVRIVLALLVLPITLLQPVPEAFAQDAERMHDLQRIIDAQQKQLETQQKQLETQQKQFDEQRQLLQKIQTQMESLAEDMYTTGGFYPVSGGFNNAGMWPSWS